jgi:hypothetical protein
LRRLAAGAQECRQRQRRQVGEEVFSFFHERDFHEDVEVLILGLYAEALAPSLAAIRSASSGGRPLPVAAAMARAKKARLRQACGPAREMRLHGALTHEVNPIGAVNA